jgi:glycosyltransferase involved in cell wall biosynthesis
MIENKTTLVFIIENKLGGVFYFNKNIIDNCIVSDNYKIRVVLVNNLSSNHNRIEESIQADEVLNFDYHSSENRYYVLKRFAKLFGNEPGAIICNDGLEMEAIALFPQTKTVYQVIHDFYNLNLAIKLTYVVDVFVTHTKLFRDILFSSNPEEIQVFFLNHGVRTNSVYCKQNDSKLTLTFVGRLIENKGIHDLILVNNVLEKNNVFVNWKIIGKGPNEEKLKIEWKDQKNVEFFSPDDNEGVHDILLLSDIFVLPTRFEGSPVTVLEALACGVVPIVTDLPGGIQEIIGPEIGFRIPYRNIDEFASKIKLLHENRVLLKKMQMNAFELAQLNFDIRNTAKSFFDLFLRFETLKKNNRNLNLKIGFRLDKKWLPNSFVKTIRSIRWMI